MIARVLLLASIAALLCLPGCRVFSSAIPCGDNDACPDGLVCDDSLCVETERTAGEGEGERGEGEGERGEGEGEGTPCGGDLCTADEACHQNDEVCVPTPPNGRCVNDNECAAHEACVLFTGEALGFCAEVCAENANCLETGCCPQSGLPECFLSRCREPCTTIADCQATGLPACTDFGVTDYCGLTED